MRFCIVVGDDLIDLDHYPIYMLYQDNVIELGNVDPRNLEQAAELFHETNLENLLKGFMPNEQ